MYSISIKLAKLEKSRQLQNVIVNWQMSIVQYTWEKFVWVIKINTNENNKVNILM